MFYIKHEERILTNCQNPAWLNPEYIRLVSDEKQMPYSALFKYSHHNADMYDSTAMPELTKNIFVKRYFLYDNIDVNNMKVRVKNHPSYLSRFAMFNDIAPNTMYTVGESGFSYHETKR
jgi:hypothetical protein